MREGVSDELPAVRHEGADARGGREARRSAEGERYPQAGVYDPPGVGGTGVVTVLAFGDRPELYGLPRNPTIPLAVRLWKGPLKSSATWRCSAGCVAAAVHFIRFGRKQLPSERGTASTPRTRAPGDLVTRAPRNPVNGDLRTDRTIRLPRASGSWRRGTVVPLSAADRSGVLDARRSTGSPSFSAAATFRASCIPGSAWSLRAAVVMSRLAARHAVTRRRSRVAPGDRRSTSGTRTPACRRPGASTTGRRCCSG